MSKTSYKEDLIKRLKSNVQVSTGGKSYFGKVTTTADKTTISNAIASRDSLSDTAIAWVKAENLDKLETVVISGTSTTYAIKALSEDQLDELEIVAIKASRAQATALAKLINTEF